MSYEKYCPLVYLLLNIFDLIFKVNERILQFFFLSNSFLTSRDFRLFFFFFQKNWRNVFSSLEFAVSGSSGKFTLY